MNTQGKEEKEDETHRQCNDCLAWVPKSWEKGSHTCPPMIKALVLRKKAIDENARHMNYPNKVISSDSF